ncbi:MAG: site-2 protease family protein [Thermoplasmata archaeon]|nr:MAG: site-2 protease family protein [Thermoplasmata archaeon]
MERKVYYSFHEIPFGHDYGYGYGKPSLRFSQREIKELLISILVLSLAFSMAMAFPAYLYFYLFFPLALLAVVTAFACHEIAHKYAGMKYGYWSEYRMFPQGLLFALLLSFAGIVFAAPGAVMIFGMPSREESGKISAAGPLANMTLAFLFIIVASAGIIKNIASAIATINAFLAFFNLIPLGPLDGRKVMAWNMAVWIIMIVMSIVLLVASF